MKKFIDIKKITKKICIFLSDKRIKNVNTFEYQVINQLFSKRIKLKNKTNFIDVKDSHEAIQKNFYFSDVLSNIFRKKFRKRDIAIIMNFDFGRTGNRFNEMRSFIQFGLSLGLKNIYLDSNDPMFNLEDNEYVLPASKIPNKLIKIRCKNAIFFHHIIWDLDIPDYKNHEKKAKDFLRRIFLTNRVTNLNNKDMVIHIRGGDIFDTSNPAKDRHQPPFSWYVKVIQNHQEKFGLEQIIIVFEDKKNPCVDALINYAKTENIKFELSSSSVENDYRWLMGAKVLVPSWGTFCDPAISLNSKLECIYKFSDDQIVQNTYIKRGEWNASPDQIQLMTDLPIECII